jgi:hypothetical protein
MADPAPTSRTAALLRSAFAIVREDVPEAHARMVGRAPRTTLLEIDEDRLALVRTTAGIDVCGADAGEGDVRVRATTEVLLAILDGKTTLLDAILAGSVFVAGEVGALADAQSAVLSFLQGCVRTTRTRELLEQFRADHDARTMNVPTGREAA